MDKHKYVLLLNHCLKRHMIGLNKKEKMRLREKFEFLEAGIWDSGVRVKKLKGISGKVVLEARLSRGDRIIFTLAKRGAQTAIYVWGLVKHDDISKTARNIFPENAPFLNFEAAASDDFADMVFEDLPEAYFAQEAIEQRSPEDHGPQKWLVLNDEEWKRMLLAVDPDDFEIYLFLTAEQREVLESDPPLLLSGTAGSGKTTLSVYYLLKREFLEKNRLFITYHRYLNEFSQKIYSGLVSKRSLEHSERRPDFYVFRDLLHELARGSGLNFDENKEVGLREFGRIFQNHRHHKKYDAELVWEEIRSIIKGAKIPIRLARFKRLAQNYVRGDITPEGLRVLREYLYGLKCLDAMDKIERIVQKRTAFSQLDDFIKDMQSGNGPPRDARKSVLGEILRLMEKRARSFSSPLLTYREYLNLGRKRAPNFLYERKDIYGIAEFYQLKLEETGRWDEIDLCRQAIRQMDGKKGTRFNYDLVVCDEVQDFADIQLSLLFSLAKSPGGMVLTGDPKQIINPSGFRWEEVKAKFYERGVDVPEVRHLNLNFRCVGNIVKLSNALLDLKQQLVGLSGFEMREEWKFSGRPPFLLTGMGEKEIIKRLSLKGAGRIVLVRDTQEQRKLKRILKTELVFTISEAKGLEFDTVFLWKFTSARKASEIWRRIKADGYVDRRHEPHVKHEINLLYVAITRARNTLIIFDSASDIWDLPLLQGFFYRTSEKDVLSEIWQRVSTPDEWERQGDYFFEREYYAAAAECYKNAGNLQRSEVALALTLEEKKDFKTAAGLFEKHGLRRKAAACYENAEQFEKALRLWKPLQEKDRILNCRIKLYEQRGEYNRAADEWVKLGEDRRALANWMKADNHFKVAEYYRSTKEYRKAAAAFEKARSYEEAASCYRKAKQPDKAADLFYRVRAFKSAVPLYKQLKNRSRLLSCYLKLGDYSNAGVLYEKDKDIGKAIDAFRDFAGISAENKAVILEEANKYHTKRSKLKSAIRFSAVGMHAQAASIFLEKGYYDRAIPGFTLSGNHEKAAECYVKLKDYYHAALEYERSDSSDKWARTEGLFEEYVRQSYEDSRNRQAKLLKEAESCFKGGSYDKALVRYRATESTDGVFGCHMNLDRDEEALSYFLKYDDFDYADRFLDEKKDLIVSPEFMQGLVARCEEGAGWYREDDESIDITARLLSLLFKRDSGRRTLDLVDRFLSSFSYHFLFHDRLPKASLDLMLEVRHCNVIIELFTRHHVRKRPMPDFLKSFVASIKKRAKMDGDQGLLACHQFLKDRAHYEKTLENLEITKRNYKLFVESRRHYHRAVDFFLERHEIEEATGVCIRHGKYHHAAEIYEQAGEYVRAARNYRDGTFYEDAIRCFRKKGDEIGIARVYERMKEFDKALAIWQRLGKTRETKRLSNKMKKETKKSNQMRLF